MSLKKYIIQEAVLLDIDEDVDYIYDNWGFKEFVEGFQKLIKDKKNGKELDTQFLIDLFGEYNFQELNDIDTIDDKGLVDFEHDYFESLDLPSTLAQKANENNPIYILTGISNRGASYNSETSEIYIPLSRIFIIFTLTSKKEQFISFEKEKDSLIEKIFSEITIKNTIKHELSHWLRDSIHNRHILKLTQKVAEEARKAIKNNRGSIMKKNDAIMKIKQKYKHLGHNDEYQTYFEMDATVNGLSASKKTMTEQEWNNLSLFELFIHHSLDIKESIRRIYTNHGKKDLDYFLKTLVKRIHRAGLLGDNMKQYNINEFITWAEAQ